MHFTIAGAHTLSRQNDKADLYPFYSSVFSRRPEVGRMRHPVRHIGYESRIDESTNLVFLGFEVTSPITIPDDFSCLTFTPKNVRLTQSAEYGIRAEQDVPINWLWRDTLGIHGKIWRLGDFAVDLSLFPNLGLSGSHEFWMNFNIFGTEEIENGDRVDLVEYRQAWPENFRSFREWMCTHFPPGLFGRIEHIGSTAIPGLAAKPIIDLLVEIPSFGEARKKVLPLLDDESWEYCWYNNHILLIKRDKYRGIRTHHLHLVPGGHEQWRCVAFRDFLRADKNRRAEYAALKKRLSRAFAKDRERYTLEKSDFVTAVTEEALRRGY